MSRNLSFEGTIAIDPPLAYGQIQGSPFLPEIARFEPLVFTVSRRTLAGGIRVRMAEAIEPNPDGSQGGDELAELVESIIADHPGSQFAGHITVFDNDHHEAQQLRVHGNAVSLHELSYNADAEA